jgi:hypothetical protein
MRRLVLGALLASALVAFAGAARADDDYKENKTHDGQDVVFKDDPLSALTSNPIGAQLSGFHLPRRFQLMHPRLTFVPQMLKTVENM